MGKSKKRKHAQTDKKEMQMTQKYNTKQLIKKEKKSKKKHPKLRLFIRIVLILFLLLILIGGGIFAGIISGWFGEDFKLSEEELKVSNLNTEIYDREGNLIETLSGDESRKWIDYGDMAEYLPTAFVSIEDERFFEHQGVDVKRTLTATVKYILSKIGIGSSDYGGSTITQQLVKNLTKEDERDAMRKIKEMGRAANLEKTLSKEQILELYLNLIFLGGQSYGVEMGSQYYFSKSASELDLAECAFLAGINNAPNAYDAFSDDEEEIKTIKNRTKTVLAKMKELGNIKSDEDYEKAIAKVDEGLPFKKGAGIQNVYSYHTDAAIDQILDQLAEEHPDWSDTRVKQYLYGGGLKIYTTQNSWVQSIAEDVVADERFQAPSDTEGEVTQAAMVIMDHTNGQVIAVVGGTGVKTVSRGFNYATMQPRQTGSCMKPISVIAPAIQDQVVTAGSVYDDIPSQIGGYAYGWPQNYDGTYFGLTTLRMQIQESHNIVPCKILNEMGIERAIEYLKSTGVTTIVEDPEAEHNDLGLGQLALGGLTNGITPLQVAAAYATIANDGEYISPTFYTKVVDSDGKVVLEPKQERRKVLSDEAAYVVQMILRQPVIAGTAMYCAIDGIEVCAKTGTTENNCDRWLCGFTPYFTAATWFGYRDQTERITGYGTNPAGQIWSRVMDRAHEGLPDAEFDEPANITYATICSSSGLLATDLCAQDQRGSQVYTEVYIKGTTPTKRCDCHVKVKAHQIEGGAYVKANEYCPDAKELVFITRPNANSDDWWKADDAKFMAPMQTCTIHKKPAETKNNTVTNNTTKNNTVTNNTTKNNTVTNNTTKNNTVTNNTTKNNTVTNNTTKDNTVTNNTTTNNAVTNNTTTNNTGTNNTTSNNTVTNNTTKNNTT